MKFGSQPLDLVIIGKSILSTYRNNNAVLYRGLINELAQQGHRTTFLEPDDPITEAHRDMLRSPYCEVWTYASTNDLLRDYLPAIASADLVMLGNGVPDSERIAEWIATEAKGVTIYYDTNLARTRENISAAEKLGNCLTCKTTGLFNLYLSTTGGPVLEAFATQHDIPHARPLYESVDPFSFYRTDAEKTYDLGYIGNYKSDRAALIEELLIGPARHTPNRRFSLAGADYPARTKWPQNLTYLEHLPATNHVDYYNRLHASLVLVHPAYQTMGHTLSRRLLAAAACGVPVLSDQWAGIGGFFEANREIFIVQNENDVLNVLYGTDETYRRKIGTEARNRILEEHTTSQRARQLLGYWREIMD